MLVIKKVKKKFASKYSFIFYYEFIMSLQFLDKF